MQKAWKLLGVWRLTRVGPRVKLAKGRQMKERVLWRRSAERGSLRSGRGWRPRLGRAFWAAGLVVGISTVLGGAPGAAAQTPSPAGPEPDAQQAGVDLAPALAAQQPELSPSARLDRAKAFVVSIDAAAQSLLRQLQAARKERDIVRALCLSDKLNQVDVALRSAQDRQSALEAAAARADADRARHEYTVLEVLDERVRVLVNESSQCVGEETGFVGEAEINVSIDPNLPDVETGFGSREAPPDLRARSELPWAQYYSLPAPPNVSSPVE
jgi:hypothetical protein